jgi:hypothetical protein
MTRPSSLWIALGGAALAGLWFLKGRSAAPDDDGRASHDHGPDVGPPLGTVDERTALARVIHSEAGHQSLAERVAVAWLAKNRARRRGVSVAELVCSPRCGKQGRGRPFSSRLPPRADDFALADAVLAAKTEDDPTGGATSGFEPVLQDRLVRERRPGYRRTAAQIRERWLSSSDFYGQVGRWELYGPKRRPLVAQR